MVLVFRTSLEGLQRNNFLPLHISCPLCWSEGFPTEQGYLVTEVRGIFELFLGLDLRSPCLALFPHPWFPCSWARPSASCLACTCLRELTLVPVFLPFYLFFSSWNWFSVLTHNKNGIFKVIAKSLFFSQASVLDLTSSARSLMFLVSLWSFLLASPFCVLLHIIFMKSVLINFETFT